MLNSTEYEFIMLIIVEMPTIVKSGPEVIKLFMLNSTDNCWHFNIYEHDKYNCYIKEFESEKKCLFVSILVFISSWNVMLSWVEHEKCCIPSGPEQTMSGQRIFHAICTPHELWN